MHKIDGPGATADYKFTEGDPAGGVPATVVTADWLNEIQGELISILAARGIPPVKGTQNQVLTAIQQMIAGAIPSAPADATEAVKGILRLATLVQVKGGTDDTAAITSAKLKAYLSGYLSGQLTITPGAQTVVTHNLGYAPDLGSTEWVFENVVAEAGWSPGEIFDPGTWKATTASTNLTNGAYAYAPTTTQITVGIGNGASWQVPTKTGGTATTITLANWRLRLRITP